LQHSPSAVIVLRKFAKYSCKVNLSVPQRSESSRSFNPSLVSTVDSLLSGRIKLRIFYMEHLDALVVEINELEIIQALKHKVTWVIEDICTLMVAHLVEEHFK